MTARRAPVADEERLNSRPSPTAVVSYRRRRSARIVCAQQAHRTGDLDEGAGKGVGGGGAGVTDYLSGLPLSPRAARNPTDRELTPSRRRGFIIRAPIALTTFVNRCPTPSVVAGTLKYETPRRWKGCIMLMTDRHDGTDQLAGPLNQPRTQARNRCNSVTGCSTGSAAIGAAAG